ncbi:cohesin loading factor-domain-containing protein [Triangularia verruculosa]|uniref:Cohesin loading factor-domain-containing protein n=1 Tax=Triangularia verruculosa TaxID=2587418 RepID=A0AAN6XPA8_9PEZI|nr:cohesin loading factor-domain-containing protein [Triangularia verruculosa]
MTYRDTMPPGQAYGGGHGHQPQHPQFHPQQQQQHAYGQHQPHQHQQRPHLPQPQGQPQPHLPPVSQNAYPQYTNGYQNGNQQQYQYNQYVHPTYPQQHPQRLPLPHPQSPAQQQRQHQPQPPVQPTAQYYQTSSAPQPQPYVNYSNGPYNQPSPNPAAAPVQFVNPSYLQQQQPVTPRPTSHVPPASQPPPRTMSPQVSHLPPSARPPLQTSSTQNSPRLSEKPPPSRATPALQIPKNQRRPSVGAGVAKSPATPGSSVHSETLPLLICLAEDFFEKANAASQKVAKSMSEAEVAEHHKLVATGLGCLDVALKSNKLWPRLEARLCLRNASVLIDETNNIMEAETTLTRGIAVCDKNRFLDLKYCSQFLLMKTLFQRNPKAAFKLIEGHISDCGTYKHVHWIYAFRFLKASFHLQAGSPAEHSAIDNLRKIAGVANQRKDHSIFAMAMLLEGFAHMTTMKDDWANRVQLCIAQVSKIQMESSVQIPQIDILLRLLDLACSLHQKTHSISAQKLNLLQRLLEELRNSPDWPLHTGEVLLSISRMPNSAPTVSKDTRAVVRQGEGNVDYLVLSTLGRHEAWAIAWVFNGIVAHYRATTPGRSATLWNEALRLLNDPKTCTGPQALPEALKQNDWGRELSCYTHILVGLQAATVTDWAKVKQNLDAIRQQPHTSPSSGSSLEILTLYLEGCLQQGTANMDEALAVWKNPRFELDPTGAYKNGSRLETELCILATLNKIYIMQEPTQKDPAETAELIDLLRPICEDNPDSEIRTAWNLVLASSTFEPAMTLNQAKRHIHSSLSGAQELNNTQYLSMALNIMRCKLFENVVGEQALKSAKAGSTQAKKSGNLLWMSVAEGMLSQSYEIEGQMQQARAAGEEGLRLANEAYQKTQI